LAVGLPGEHRNTILVSGVMAACSADSSTSKEGVRGHLVTGTSFTCGKERRPRTQHEEWIIGNGFEVKSKGNDT